MSVKERIYFEIDSLAQNELALLFEQIKLIKSPLTIEEIHRHTSSSKTSWAEAVSNEREERI